MFHHFHDFFMSLSLCFSLTVCVWVSLSLSVYLSRSSLSLTLSYFWANVMDRIFFIPCNNRRSKPQWRSILIFFTHNRKIWRKIRLVRKKTRFLFLKLLFLSYVSILKGTAAVLNIWEFLPTVFLMLSLIWTWDS